ncbi:MAG: M20 family peptidase, partial [Actinobacteria bacterium]|nr:M20 family peptidase [Actinomycetota bacterium]
MTGEDNKDLSEYLRALVEAESPSSDPVATRSCAEAVATLSQQILNVAPEIIEVDDRTHLRWRFGAETPVMMLGHFDTVWPVGTLASFPYRV